MDNKKKMTAPLWVRVQKSHRDYIDRKCTKTGRSRSDVVDEIISEHKEATAMLIEPKKQKAK